MKNIIQDLEKKTQKLWAWAAGQLKPSWQLVKTWATSGTSLAEEPTCGSDNDEEYDYAYASP